MHRCRWIPAAAAVAVATLLPACGTREEPRDVLLVTLDTLRADFLGPRALGY